MVVMVAQQVNETVQQKMVKMVNFMLCVFYLNKNFFEIKMEIKLIYCKKKKRERDSSNVTQL